MKRTIIILLICSAQMLAAQETILPGLIRIKLKPAANEQMTRLSPQMKYSGVGTSADKPTISIPLESLNALNTAHKATSMRRVFPHAGKHESKQEKHGLHLWYDVATNDNTHPLELLKSYRNDPNIDLAEPVLRVIYHNGLQEPGTRNQDLQISANDYTTTTQIEHISPQDYTPDDPDYTKQWHYHNTGQNGGTPHIDVGLNEAWSMMRGSPEVIVAVVDGGIDVSHEDLKDNLWTNLAELNGTPGVDDDGNGYIDDTHGFNFVAGYGYNPSSTVYGPAPLIPSRHGTHVAGTVAARTGNRKGGAGVAGGDNLNRGVSLMSCQTMVDGSDNGAYLAAAIAYAANNGAVILQNSWGFAEEGYQSASLLTAIRYFITAAGSDSDGNPMPGTPMHGGIVIFAAGNENSSGNWYPPRYDEVIAVASVNNKGKRARYSNYGDWVDIAAPGGETSPATAGGVYSTIPGNRYEYLQGTSMACPHVSGIAALALSRYGSPTYTPDQLRVRLLAGVDPLPDDTYAASLGSGLIKASKVIADYVPVEGINLPPTIEVPVGRTIELTPDVLPANATDQRASYTIANTNIATVKSKTSIQGKTIGTTNITATTSDGAYTATAQLNVIPVPVESIAIDPAQLSIIKGNHAALTAHIYPADASTKDLTWHSLHPDVATVNHSGHVSAHQLGHAGIVATSTDGGYSDTCHISVEQPVLGLQIEQEHIRILRGDAITVTAQVLPDNAFDKTLSWTSSNTDVISIIASGRALAKHAGEATITATTTDGAHQASCIATVYEDIHAPQGFSPNGDGINDYFVVTIDSRRKHTLKVFDRSGQLHYQSSDYRNDWDGVANTGPRKGSLLSAGTYFYSLSTSDGAARKGFLVIRY